MPNLHEFYRRMCGPQRWYPGQGDPVEGEEMFEKRVGWKPNPGESAASLRRWAHGAGLELIEPTPDERVELLTSGHHTRCPACGLVQDLSFLQVYLRDREPSLDACSRISVYCGRCQLKTEYERFQQRRWVRGQDICTTECGRPDSTSLYAWATRACRGHIAAALGDRYATCALCGTVWALIWGKGRFAASVVGKVAVEEKDLNGIATVSVGGEAREWRSGG